MLLSIITRKPKEWILIILEVTQALILFRTLTPFQQPLKDPSYSGPFCFAPGTARTSK